MCRLIWVVAIVAPTSGMESYRDPFFHLFIHLSTFATYLASTLLFRSDIAFGGILVYIHCHCPWPKFSCKGWDLHKKSMKKNKKKCTWCMKVMYCRSVSLVINDLPHISKTVYECVTSQTCVKKACTFRFVTSTCMTVGCGKSVA